MATKSKLGSVVTVALIVLGIALIYGYMSQPKIATKSLLIDIPEAKARRFGLIIDVRTPKERQLLGFYPNSIPMSVDTIQREVPMDITNKNAWILVYSNADSRAKVAAEALFRAGYPNVRYINKSYLSLMPGSQ
jgi:rhodanese-related sulfurtransferase